MEECFAKIDFLDAFLQLEVEEDSKELLTINTHKGLFRYNRLPFGVKTAPSIFQQTMDAMLTGITGATAFLDDIIVSGTSQDELLQWLISVFERIQQYGFHVNITRYYNVNITIFHYNITRYYNVNSK